MYEEVDIREIKKDLKRKFSIDSEIIHSDLINGLGINNTYFNWRNYKEIDEVEFELAKIVDYIQKEYECFCEYLTLESDYEVIFNIY